MICIQKGFHGRKICIILGHMDEVLSFPPGIVIPGQFKGFTAQKTPGGMVSGDLDKLRVFVRTFFHQAFIG